MDDEAQALWLTGPGRAELRPTGLGDGPVLVRTLFSGISRGTESLVAAGRVPASEHDRMRAPLQEGTFPFPVKYGYAAVGEVIDGPPALLGRSVFALHPHQDRFRLPEAMAVLLPDTVPPARAILAANMETALTIVWDARIGPGDRVAVIGAGLVGALVGTLAARIPGTEVTLVDLNPDRAALAPALGCAFASPDAAPTECDVVIHASASAAGLSTALAAAGLEARVVEASWHGEGDVPVPLGGAFHSRRLSLVSSQVGRIPADRAARWTHRRRLETALGLLANPALDALVSGETAFADLPGAYGAILADPATLCHRVRY
jgi:NADPH:quinone reductase-like Zn-dependent oxidoreductase